MSLKYRLDKIESKIMVKDDTCPTTVIVGTEEEVEHKKQELIKKYGEERLNKETTLIIVLRPSGNQDDISKKAL